MQDKEPQPRDTNTIIVDVPNIFYLEHQYDNLDMYENYDTYFSIVFFSTKKELDLKLLLKLWKDGLIKTPGALFEAL
jgi:hypothetical protein